jgi:hypothetical protein
MTEERLARLEDELLLIRHSGELPVVAYYGALHHLTEDSTGPRLTLTAEETGRLQQAVADRFRRILLRDLDPRLRHRTVYRGLERCAVNWRRWCAFCRREGLEPNLWRGAIAAALEAFLARELADVAGGAISSVDCGAARLAALAADLGLPRERLPEGWEALCPPA